ncbi:hypothetical protein [Piscirickettsia salmonis]|uniref:hypothetical protein n=1 Tax=Piscirickettsia salmonis TaxID=1238 RepID=UPI0007C99571|nr:hypothetical protein A0O36_00440 [Piscirickettsiaceae bacterium NZ-RLO1]
MSTKENDLEKLLSSPKNKNNVGINTTYTKLDSSHSEISNQSITDLKGSNYNEFSLFHSQFSKQASTDLEQNKERVCCCKIL